jgi:hypothetical protein
MIDPITKKKIDARELLADIDKCKRHVEAAPDEETEIAYLEVLRKWKIKFARAVGAKPPKEWL